MNQQKFIPEKINNKFKGKDIVSIEQFNVKSIMTLFKAVDKVKQKIKKKKHFNLLKGVLSILLFYEPSSRTMSSFASSIKRLGGQTVEYSNPMQTSSAVKGETFSDSINVFETYSDILIIRHPESGAALKAVQAAKKVPIINAGDGYNEHPTQALLDLYTIYKKFGRLNNLKILMAGDLLYGRTVHSLLKALSMFKNNETYLLSPPSLKISRELYQEIGSGLRLKEIASQDEIPTGCDVWYWTRVQKERFKNIKIYEKLKLAFVLTKKLLDKKGNKNLIIMHPLPRVGEIETVIDADSSALYLRDQIQNGLSLRMGLLCLIFDRI